VSAGFFIVFEGCEGAGKSTHVKRLAAHLQSLGHDVVTTREPGGTPTAEMIRSILLNPDVHDLPDSAEALLFAAARADHAANLIRPALTRGAVVICDRYLESSVAYQGIARGLGEDRIRELSMWATGGLLPDFTLYLQIPVDASSARMDGEDRMEAQSSDFHAMVHEAFRYLAQNSTRPHAVIDATAPKDDVELAIRAAVLTAMAAR
jgi:dTMP kinase